MELRATIATYQSSSACRLSMRTTPIRAVRSPKEVPSYSRQPQCRWARSIGAWGATSRLARSPSPVDVELAFPTKPISSLSTGVRKGSEVGKSEPASQRVFRTGEAVPASASVYRMTGPHRLTKHSMRPATSKLPPAHRDRIEATQDLDSRTCVSDPPIELLF